MALSSTGVLIRSLVTRTIRIFGRPFEAVGADHRVSRRDGWISAGRVRPRSAQICPYQAPCPPAPEIVPRWHSTPAAAGRGLRAAGTKPRTESFERLRHRERPPGTCQAPTDGFTDKGTPTNPGPANGPWEALCGCPDLTQRGPVRGAPPRPSARRSMIRESQKQHHSVDRVEDLSSRSRAASPKGKLPRPV